ncbi:hydroxyethylthiazole kinase [Treponema zioleckii]|uniref:hydroxyethylthiazole kinase n=1 Tax=Treponema zioleckii TaxID=331680 RepID=UPI00168B2DF7|nr:hydroxyethylthiazole kinase [Treponema zioleckii]
MEKSQIKMQIEKAVDDARKKKPLAPSITNTVTVNLVANAQLAVGGSAAMVYLPDEGEWCAENGDAVYLNAGTLFPVYEETFPRTMKALHENKTPWVLDPVGLGIGSLRTKLVSFCKDFPPTIVRANASEVIALSKLWGLSSSSSSEGPKGVDSVDSVLDAKDAAKALAKFIHGAVAVSGEEDFVTDGEVSVVSKGGSYLFEKITGAGCSLGGVCAVYSGVANPFIAALTATQIYNLAGKRAEKECSGPGSFQVKFLDELYNAAPSDVAENPFDFA